MPNIGCQVQLQTFDKRGNNWDANENWNETIKIEKELAIAVKDLVQLEVNDREKLFVTYDFVILLFVLSFVLLYLLYIQMGLLYDDLQQFKKEWVLLVFLCDQYQKYEISIH